MMDKLHIGLDHPFLFQFYSLHFLRQIKGGIFKAIKVKVSHLWNDSKKRNFFQWRQLKATFNLASKMQDSEMGQEKNEQKQCVSCWQLTILYLSVRHVIVEQSLVVTLAHFCQSSQLKIQTKKIYFLPSGSALLKKCCSQSAISHASDDRNWPCFCLNWHSFLDLDNESNLWEIKILISPIFWSTFARFFQMVEALAPCRVTI